MDFLPVSREDMRERHIEQLDFVYVIGDAYVDHPSFGPAIISRSLEAQGYTVGIISQPDWHDPAQALALGRPRLAFLLSSGNMDSMVNHYYVSKKRREADAYTPGGAIGRRPDYAIKAYGQWIRRACPDAVIIAGGIEASLRRLAHYDYWSDRFLPSLLIEGSLDMISYGMGEKTIVEIAQALDSGLDIQHIQFLAGTVFATRDLSSIDRPLLLPGYAQMQRDKRLYAQSFLQQQEQMNPILGRPLAEEYPDGRFVVVMPPPPPLSTQEMDAIYRLPFTRRLHPAQEAIGPVPATAEIQFSLISNRGCFGACNFCALTFHQGRTIQSRSHDSLLEEAVLLTRDRDFKGYIHDVGGPTANFRKPSCRRQLEHGVCPKKQCLHPKPCGNLEVDHEDYRQLLSKMRRLPGVKKVFIRSGIRYDYLLEDKNTAFFNDLVEHHISGQLKVAPEHISDTVLEKMGKPSRAVYDRFCQKYKKINEKLGKKQFLVPYLMSSHPGSGLSEAIALAEYLRDIGYTPQQVQDFYPTPSTMSTVMYYTGLDPRTMESVYVCKNPHEKAMQRALIQYKIPKNYALVREALQKAGREDLIGYGPKCLIRPPGGRTNIPGPPTAERRDNKASPQTPIGRGMADKPAKKKKTIRNIHKKKGAK